MSSFLFQVCFLSSCSFFYIDIHITLSLLQDFDGDEITMTFTVNGEIQGVAYKITHSELQDKALFPHVLSKNTKFKCNFGTEDSWFAPPDGYTYVAHIAADQRVSGPKRPERREDCEVPV
jgi:heterogeneous nuclear ribonucleoprotein U-like protein 1